jgi:hypothetical protein
MLLPLCLCVLVLNGEAQVTKTERFDFPAGGLLQLDNSVGELTIEGWDLPEVEITTTRSTTNDKALDRIQTTTERRGNRVIVTTEFPRYAVFPPPVTLRSGADFYLEYRIKAPRSAGLVVNHDSGEVLIENMTGDIRVTVSKGRITLRLPPDEYAIDAKADIGDVVSDFAGQKHRRPWLFGHRFGTKTVPAAHEVYLRAGFGDIAILKVRQPPYALR